MVLLQNGKAQVRGRLNLIGRLQLSAEQSREAEHDDIVALRVLRVQVRSAFVLCWGSGETNQVGMRTGVQVLSREVWQTLGK